MVINKTSVLPRMCIRLISSIIKGHMKQSGQCTENFEKQSVMMVKYIELLGAAFQIQDDLIALVSEDYAKERGLIGEDIHEGKRTLMVLNSYWSQTLNEKQKKRLVKILDLNTTDSILLQEAIDILHESGSIKYSEQLAKDMLS